MIEPKIVINEIGMGSACKIITTHIIVLFFIDILLSAFITSFAFVLQRHRAKPIPLVGRGFTPAALLD